MTVDLSTTLVVMPALNEEESIAHVIREVFAVSRKLTILVVNDGSEDATAQVARSAGALVASLPYNLGVGGAMRCGFRYASAHGFDNVVQVDADGQHAPADIPRLIANLAHADLVLGARFAGVGDYQARGLRRLAMIVLAKVLSRTTRTTLTDTTSGFRASGPRAVALFAQHYPAEYLGDTVESLVIAARANLVIRQVPVAMRERSGGTPSQSPLRATAYLARVGIGIVFALIRPKISNHAEESSR
ncbi:dolichyl-phosphate mannose synthase [freshwater metagenome]|uniref:Dolichyl-phosphate mannose synthase n=1 Tax=freshwater metagenome TaxID=449393 RepID=A0A094Q9S2_9ZZZZ